MTNGKADSTQSSGTAGGQAAPATAPLNLEALRDITYGMYVVASRKGNKFNAQIANTVFQITSQPPTIAVSINKKNLTHEFISDGKVFTASSLCEETPLPFIGRFGFKSGRDGNKLEGVNYKIGVTGAPIVIDNATSYVEARVIGQTDVGTHTVFVGEIVAADVLMKKACMTYGYYQTIKRGTTPQTAPTFIQKKVEAKPALARWRCLVCGWIYDPEKGDPDGDIKPGVAFEALPENYRCPICGAPKSQFEKLG